MTCSRSDCTCTPEQQAAGCAKEATGPRCSCRARPAGECTCDKAAEENAKPTGSTCACGARPADACTCEKASSGGSYDKSNEVDFTTKK